MAISQKQYQALEVLLSGGKIWEAAIEAGVSTRQVFRWLKNESFTRLLHDIQSKQIEAISSKLITLSSRAVEELESVLDRPGQDGSNIKRLVAVSILELSLRFNEQVSLVNRILKLEVKDHEFKEQA